MNLTQDQARALDQGEAIPVVVNGRECILVARDAFDRVRSILDIDPAQAYPAIDEAWREGWDAPGMSDYDRYEELRP
jgi:hypothetical protein